MSALTPDLLDAEAKALAPTMAEYDLDAVDLDMVKRGDMLGPRLGAKVFSALAAALRERDEAREALKPFAAYAPFVRMFVQGRAAQGGSPTLPTRHFRLADFERAESALSEQPDKERT